MKKYIYWGLFIAFVIGSIVTGGPFNLIDLIVVRPIVNIQFMIFNLVHDFGVAIIIFAVLVKLCMWPLTKRQLNQIIRFILENMIFSTFKGRPRGRPLFFAIPLPSRSPRCGARRAASA